METVKRRALGMGLEELFNNEKLDLNKFEENIVNSTPNEEVMEVELSELRSNPYQPRKVFDEEKLKELAESIKQHGVFQPIIVKKSIKGYEIVAGERRVKASIIAGKTKIPAIIRNFSDEEMMEIALIENLQRENLNAIEEAQAYSKLLQNLNITQEELAIKMGKSRSHVTNMIGLITLPDEVKKMISDNLLSMGHARVLSKLKDKDEIIKLAKKIIDENLSVRDAERISQNPNIEKKHKIINKQADKKYLSLENLLSEKYGTKVKIKNNKMIFSFVNDNDLNRLLEILEIKD